MVFERRIAREALLDAVLGKDLEPWSFAPRSTTTQAASEAADNEEVVDEQVLQSKIKMLSLAFDSDELNDMLAASAAPPPPLRCSWRSAAMVSRVYSWPLEQETEGLPDAHLAWGGLAQRYKLAKPAPPSPKYDNDKSDKHANLSPVACCVDNASTFAATLSASDTFLWKTRPAQG
jgi:hypothetical protein